ncbi:hypothetical protein B0H65DRAFT_508404 [Neurospora tetraspora]|uniref:C2H2-type domain-containing protein n=1 Tax=Neurospora tetraspora TaxID=94610 RepID=A0AAE0JJ06_9PEZI|nr:hypothetical protein B0H65DRAFT_508404 [Neurospora tetraspora]
MRQSSDQQQSAEQSTFATTATGEFICTDPECKTKPVFKRKCDLTKHQNNHRRPRKCPIEGCTYGGAEQKDLNRHLWSYHPVYSREKNIPKEETMCDFPGCDYKGRKDNVRRHKDTVGHHREQP